MTAVAELAGIQIEFEELKVLTELAGLIEEPELVPGLPEEQEVLVEQIGPENLERRAEKAGWDLKV